MNAEEQALEKFLSIQKVPRLPLGYPFILNVRSRRPLIGPCFFFNEFREVVELNLPN